MLCESLMSPISSNAEAHRVGARAVVGAAFPGVILDQSKTDPSGDEVRASFRCCWGPIVTVMNLSLTQCPYDGALLDAEIDAGGVLLLICAACEAAWETHGSYVGRVREPDRDKLIAARGDAHESDSAPTATAGLTPRSARPDRRFS
jgi:hypothetical protein